MTTYNVLFNILPGEGWSAHPNRISFYFQVGNYTVSLSSNDQIHSIITLALTLTWTAMVGVELVFSSSWHCLTVSLGVAVQWNVCGVAPKRWTVIVGQ